MNPHEMLTKQIEKWMELTADFVDKTASKTEKEIIIN